SREAGEKREELSLRFPFQFENLLTLNFDHGIVPDAPEVHGAFLVAKEVETALEPQAFEGAAFFFVVIGRIRVDPVVSARYVQLNDLREVRPLDQQLTLRRKRRNQVCLSLV